MRATNRENGSKKRRKTRTLWNSVKFYSDTCPRNRYGKKDAGEKQHDNALPSPTDNPTPTLIINPRNLKRITPTKKDFKEINKRNKTRTIPTLHYILRAHTTTPRSFQDSLILGDIEFKTRTYEKSRQQAINRFEVIHKGKVTRRTIKQTETTPPNYNTVKIPLGFTYRFYFYDIEQKRTFTREKSNNKPRLHPTRTITKFYQITNKTIRFQQAFNLMFGELDNAPRYPQPTNTVKIPLTLIRIIQIKPIKTLIWSADLKPRYKEKTTDNPNPQPIRNNAENMIVIDYARLFRAEKRISKKWFALLLDSLKDESKIIELTPHLKKLRNKVITSIAHPTNTLKKRTLKPRRATVKDFNENLADQARESTDKMRDRKRALKIKRLLIA